MGVSERLRVREEERREKKGRERKREERKREERRGGETPLNTGKQPCGRSNHLPQVDTTVVGGWIALRQSELQLAGTCWSSSTLPRLCSEEVQGSTPTPFCVDQLEKIHDRCSGQKLCGRDPSSWPWLIGQHERKHERNHDRNHERNHERNHKKSRTKSQNEITNEIIMNEKKNRSIRRRQGLFGPPLHLIFAHQSRCCEDCHHQYEFQRPGGCLFPVTTSFSHRIFPRRGFSHRVLDVQGGQTQGATGWGGNETHQHGESSAHERTVGQRQVRRRRPTTVEPPASPHPDASARHRF